MRVVAIAAVLVGCADGQDVDLDPFPPPVQHGSYDVNEVQDNGCALDLDATHVLDVEKLSRTVEIRTDSADAFPELYRCNWFDDGFRCEGTEATPADDDGVRVVRTHVWESIMGDGVSEILYSVHRLEVAGWPDEDLGELQCESSFSATRTGLVHPVPVEEFLGAWVR